ncbi:hypothetical protein CFP56_035232 [Quercus suber]|uniref:Uncharacterized protein n=1 Tax=Quercus suber TaxID=58331 RepID=A0AAW0LRE8_QUESU
MTDSVLFSGEVLRSKCRIANMTWLYSGVCWCMWFAEAAVSYDYRLCYSSRLVMCIAKEVADALCFHVSVDGYWWSGFNSAELSTVATLTAPYGDFRYEGNSSFHVLIFDKIATEKIIDLDEDDTNISPSDDLPTKHEVKEKFVTKKFSSMSRGRERERAIQAAEKFKPKNPSFMGISRPHNMVSLYK